MNPQPALGKDAPAASVLLSTYNAPRALRLVLWGYAQQTRKDFEIVIADDGSTDATRTVIDAMRVATNLRLRHVWQEDDGFRKNRILNRAILEAQTDYLIVSDGDCIPRPDFVAAHLTARRPRTYLSGGYTKLPNSLSQRVAPELVQSGACFESKWLQEGGVRQSWTEKSRVRGPWARFLNALTPTPRTWNGHNASGWRADILGVNGYDESMGYGAEDSELGYRLQCAGIRARQVRYLAICLHLEHDRPYRIPAGIATNRRLIRERRRARCAWTPYGIRSAD